MAIKCLECNTIIESKYRHDMVWCKCGGLFIDGGKDYTRVGGRNLDNYECVEEGINEQQDD